LTAWLTACAPPDWELDVTVRVPVGVQEDYSGGYPAQLVMIADRAPASDPHSTGGSARRLGSLCCDPQSSQPCAKDVTEFTVHAKFSGSECDAPRYLRAWMEPREEDAESRCGPLDDPRLLPGVRKPPLEGPIGSIEAFEHGGKCPTGQESVTLTITRRR
jgi:hypothetical protein